MAASEIEDCDGLKTAIDEYNAKGEHNQAEQAALLKRSIDLGCVDHIPDDWGVDVEHG